MAKKLTSVLGIDIGSRTIKFCEMRKQGNEPMITALGMVDTPEGAVDHQGVYNGEAVAAVLKGALSGAGASVGQAVVSIAGQSAVLVRTLEVPKMNAQELKDHMSWEINRNIPFAESTVVSDFKPLGDDDPNSPNMDVVMAIAPQSAIDTMIDLVKRAGKAPVAIDVEPLSMARSLESSYGDELSNKTVCFVDLGATTCAINIYYGSKLIMPRQIPLGGDLVTKAIADLRVLPLAEAEAVKRNELRIPEDAAQLFAAPVNPFDTPGVPTQEFSPFDPFNSPAETPINPFADDAPSATPATTPAIDPLVSASMPIINDLVDEIRRSVDFFRSRGGNVDIIVLAGGGAKIPGLTEYIANTIGVPCDAYDPLRRLNVNARKVAPDFVDAHRQEFTVAVGNGLHIFFE
jgi:type IV pilus assembly protein PilM